MAAIRTVNYDEIKGKVNNSKKTAEKREMKKYEKFIRRFLVDCNIEWMRNHRSGVNLPINSFCSDVADNIFDSK